MKRTFIHIIFSVFLSAMFLFAGTGYNLTHYCCNDCKKVGIEEVAEMSCESVHEKHCHTESTTHQHHTAMGVCTHELAKGCDVERLTVDIPSVQQVNHKLPDYSLFFFDLNDFQSSLSLLLADCSIEPKRPHTPQKIPIPLPGRLILSQKSVLII